MGDSLGDSLSENQISAFADDVEAQQSPWLSKVQETLCVIKEEVPNEMGFHILKVPEYNRQPPAQYNPVACRFGLHNREDLDVTGLEDLKLHFVVIFGLEDQSEWNHFCNAIVPDPKSMLESYGLHWEVSKLSEKEVQQVLALDALFLAVSVGMNLGIQDNRLWTPECIKRNPEQFFHRTYYRWSTTVDLDLCKIENQIPFDLVNRVITYISKTLSNLEYESDEAYVDQSTQLGSAKEGIMGRHIKYIKKCTDRKLADRDHPVSDAEVGHVPGEPYLEKWMKQAMWSGMLQFMVITDVFYEKENAHPRLLKCDHILDAAYKAICGAQGVKRAWDRTQKDYIFVPSATRLKESGIKIVGVPGALCTMSYNPKRKCLSLPKMKLHDETVAIVQNMARYEEYSSGNKCMFHDYVLLMLDHIKTPEDYEFLTEWSVIENGFGEKGFETWKAVDYGITLLKSSTEHNEMKRNINSRCKLRRYRLWSEFRTLFLSRPWLALSALAVILVTAATLIQTYAAVIQWNEATVQTMRKLHFMLLIFVI